MRIENLEKIPECCGIHLERIIVSNLTANLFPNLR